MRGSDRVAKRERLRSAADAPDEVGIMANLRLAPALPVVPEDLHGKPIVALPSTARNSSISRIVACLKPGAGVVTKIFE